MMSWHQTNMEILFLVLTQQREERVTRWSESSSPDMINPKTLFETMVSARVVCTTNVFAWFLFQMPALYFSILGSLGALLDRYRPSAKRHARKLSLMRSNSWRDVQVLRDVLFWQDIRWM